MTLDDEAVSWKAHEALDRGENPTKQRRFRGICSVDGCDRKRESSLGLCHMHRLRVRRGQPAGPAVSLKDAEYRFSMSYEVDEQTACWVWVKYRDYGGYGRFANRNGSGMAHRWAYEHFVGPIPEGLTLDHLCRNTSCVNPDHLEPVTRAENTRRQRALNAPTHCPHGHPYDEENTYVDPRGARECITCRRIRQAAKYRRDAS